MFVLQLLMREVHARVRLFATDLPTGDAEAILLEVACTREGVEVVWSMDNSDWAVDIFTLQFSCTDPLNEEQVLVWTITGTIAYSTV